MISVTLFCVLAVYIPFAQGNDQNGFRDILKNDLTLLKEFKPREKREACADKSLHCSTYKDYCNDPGYEDYLEKECRATCNLCGDECVDIIDCEVYQSYCNNEEWANSMEYYCPATCGFCEGLSCIGEVKEIWEGDYIIYDNLTRYFTVKNL